MQMDPLLHSATCAVSAHENCDVGDLEDFPVATYVTDSSGVVRHFNRACVPFAGRVPQVGIDKWCVTWELYTQSGRRLPHDECPMAISIREKRAIDGARAFALRPDRTSIQFEPSPIPLFDDNGCFVGAVNLLRDVGQVGKSSSLWAEAARCRRLVMSMHDEKSVDILKARARDCEQKAIDFESGIRPASKPIIVTRNELLLGIKLAAIGEHARVFFGPGAVLVSADERIDFVYFIESGLASAMTRHGARDVDVAMVGPEGMVGYECLLGARRATHTTVMRFEGSAIRMSASDAIRLRKANPQFEEGALSFVRGFCKQLAENCAANALLGVESRLARWLLSASERLGPQLIITHDLIASAIGTRRAGVTVAIHILEGTKAIKSTRAHLSVLDREQLMELAKFRRS